MLSVYIPSIKLHVPSLCKDGLTWQQRLSRCRWWRRLLPKCTSSSSLLQLLLFMSFWNLHSVKLRNGQNWNFWKRQKNCQNSFGTFLDEFLRKNWKTEKIVKKLGSLPDSIMYLCLFYKVIKWALQGLFHYFVFSTFSNKHDLFKFADDWIWIYFLALPHNI